MKMNLINEYINQLNDNEVILFVDAYDVFINKDSKLLLNELEINKAR